MAFAVALAGGRLHPPVAPPAPLRPFLRFKKLPLAALGPLRRVVESDTEFRERVAVVATDELVDRSSWLWIHRPERWEEELLARWADESAANEAEAAERAERSAQKRLDAAEQAARRANAELAALGAELHRERTARHEQMETASAAERRARQLEIELGGARRRLQAAEGELAVVRARLGELEAELDRRAGEIEASEGAAPVVDEAPVPEPEPAVARAAAPGDAEALSSALAAAVTATTQLAAALDAARRALGGAAPPSAPAPAPAAVVPGESDAARLHRIGTDALRRPRRASTRREAALPVGMLPDSTEAAVHLLRLPDVLALIDGYNVAKLAWPSEPLPEQRRRLLDLVVELTARHPAEVRVVFDGSDVGEGRHGTRNVRVQFSAPGVSADDLLRELVEQVPAARPVVVVTSDRALSDDLRARGANLIRSDQFLAAARRLPGSASAG